MSAKLTLALLVGLILPLSAEEIMKITMKSGPTEQTLASISKIVFTETSLNTGSMYNLDDIVKIEFYTSNTAILPDNGKHSSKNSLKAGQIGIETVGRTLNLTLMEPQTLTVSLFALNGREVAKLYNGTAAMGKLSVSLENLNIGAGVYSVVISSSNVVFAQKIILD